MRTERFEALDVWQKARVIAREIYAMTATGNISKDYALRDQMRRAAVSVLSNIAEGFERGGNKEFVHFLYIAKGSAGELRAQLYVAQDQDYLDRDKCEVMRSQLERVSKMLNGLISYLRNSDMRGIKFKGTSG